MKGVICVLLSFWAVFWNVENFFDYFDGGYSSSDSEFSSRGARHWTKKRFYSKAEMVGKTLLWAGAPCVVGLAEVENSFVVRKISQSEALRKIPYDFVHFDSPDPRGIDVALLYRSDSLRLMRSRALRVDSLRTRDILYAELERLCDGSHWHFLVNHHPSKYGGDVSSLHRKIAMRVLLRCVDSLRAAGCTNIVAMGDFNDVPSGEAFSLLEPPPGAAPTLVNMGASIAGIGVGSIRYRGDWQLIDNFLLSPDALSEGLSMELLSAPFLLQREVQWPGVKPRRTYIGPRYNGGVSDHLPVGLKIRCN